MTDATLYPYRKINVPGIKSGYCTAQNGYTSKFGFASCQGVVLTEGQNSGDIIGVTLSSGTATITVKDHAGNAVAADRTLYYFAWGVV